MNIQLLDKTYLCEIPIPGSNTSTAAQIPFPTLNNLDGKFIQGMSAYGVAAMPKAPSGAAVSNALLFAASFVNLFVGDNNNYWNMPLIDFVTIRNSASASTVHYNPYAIEFENKQIIWAKSFIFIANTALFTATAEAFVVNIKYTDGAVKKEI